MSAPKWGESFLKSGLPLEHLTAVTFRDLGWQINTQLEYTRRNRENKEALFELDLVATSPRLNHSTELSFLVECKYHDLSRNWFFLPFEPSDKLRCNDGHVYNFGPYKTLENQFGDTVLCRAPVSTGGIVVSSDGQRQENSVQTAIQQLVNGFVPYSLARMFKSNLNTEFRSSDFVPIVTALLPMIVTNASLYRLRADVTDLDEIRKAKAPKDIADELEWTWSYHSTQTRLGEQNWEAIQRHVREEGRYVFGFPHVESTMWEFLTHPYWIAVVNVKALSKVVATVEDCFAKLETTSVEDIVPPRVRRNKASEPD